MFWGGNSVHHYNRDNIKRDISAVLFEPVYTVLVKGSNGDNTHAVVTRVPTDSVIWSLRRKPFLFSQFPMVLWHWSMGKNPPLPEIDIKSIFDRRFSKIG